MVQKSLHLVDPELLPVLKSFARLPLSDATLPALREMALPLVEEPSEAGRQVQVVCFSVPGPQDAPEVGVIVYRPPQADTALPCIFHIHGGGYILGRAGQREAKHRDLAASLHCAIVTVDYRLAPETPFPGPINDCYAALQWLFAEAPNLGIDATRIGVAGESAGGGLAAALALMVRDRGEYNLTFQHLVYPMLDDRTGVSGSPHPLAGEFIWTAHDNAFAWVLFSAASRAAKASRPMLRRRGRKTCRGYLRPSSLQVLSISSWRRISTTPVAWHGLEFRSNCMSTLAPSMASKFLQAPALPDFRAQTPQPRWSGR